MITAQTISDALNGKIEGNKYRCDCPVGNHRSAKMIVSDRDDGTIGVYCFGGCDFIDIVTELKSLGLWPKPEYSPAEKLKFKKEKSLKEYDIAKTWIEIYLANKDKRTGEDTKKYIKYTHEFKYLVWADEVVAQAKVKRRKGYKHSDKQLITIRKAQNMLKP